MTERDHGRWMAVLVPALLAGIVGSAFTLAGSDQDDALLYRQQNPLRLSSADVERLVKTAPEPAEGSHPPGVAAQCAAGSDGEFRNPWSCRVRYRSGLVAAYRVTVRSDGSYVGDYRGRRGVVRGCCADVPGSE